MRGARADTAIGYQLSVTTPRERSRGRDGRGLARATPPADPAGGGQAHPPAGTWCYRGRSELSQVSIISDVISDKVRANRQLACAYAGVSLSSRWSTRYSTRAALTVASPRN
jgi:hypothetical protein